MVTKVNVSSLVVALLPLVHATVNFNNDYPGFQGVEPRQAFNIIPGGGNPLQIWGNMLGAGNYPASDWNDWQASARCNVRTSSGGSAAATGEVCTTAAIVQSISTAVRQASSQTDNNAAQIRFIGPINNFWNYYREDRGQGPSCPTCPGPNADQTCSAWQRDWLFNSGYSFSWPNKQIKVTCKKSCAATNIDQTNLENILALLPRRVQLAGAMGANFFFRRDYSNEVVGRCRLTILGDATYLGGQDWRNTGNSCPDLVYGGETPGNCFHYG
ncbi:hypothetical protein BDZ85DRAFT_31636 [Elsinoe ampelina]|uniref:Uncharacterized protein n=1 Tax=Elsinoe ampelina TaxID=302913 RepID=A0A6A6G3R0_9PEZI|nr:hypothetical protein BDZ85DRAFT_31636 [Elsinoe ampelina]